LDQEARARLTSALGRLGDGDRTAMSEVYGGLIAPVRALAKRLLAHEQDAEDAAEDVMVEIFERSADFERDRDALAWALTITVWCCRTERRRRSRRRIEPLDVGDAVASSMPDPEQMLVERHQRELLRQVAGELDPLDREALDAVLSGEPLSAALRKRKQRLLVRLRRMLIGGDLE
jgi:DNA-directed RNA polymerase specialized sigma24 family protein